MSRTGHNDVEDAVVIQIGGSDIPGLFGNRNGKGCLESTIPIAEQDPEALAGRIRDGDVSLAIAVEVTDDQPDRLRAWNFCE